MTALASMRSNQPEKWTRNQFLLAATNAAWKGGMACLSLAGGTAGKVVPGATSATLLFIGTFNENKASSASDQLVDVDLGTEIEVRWYANGAASIAASDVGGLCYIVDDQTVSGNSSGKTLAGRIWKVDAVKGVAVQKLTETQLVASADDVIGTTSAALVFVSNDAAPTTIEDGTVYDIPTTGAASTVTLPTAAHDGAIAYFSADGTKNGHTVQYRDGLGPVNITGALTASKRHLVTAVKAGGKWYATATVSP